MCARVHVCVTHKAQALPNPAASPLRVCVGARVCSHVQLVQWGRLGVLCQHRVPVTLSGATGLELERSAFESQVTFWLCDL